MNRTWRSALFSVLAASSLVLVGACGGSKLSNTEGAGSDGGSTGDSGALARDAAGRPNNGSDSSAPRTDTGVPDNTCERQLIESERVPANVLIVLDASGSMYYPEQGIDRWNPAIGAVRSVTASLESSLRFGLMVFPVDNQCGPGTLRVEPQDAAASAISTALDGDPDAMTGGGTPTAATLQAAGAVLSGLEGDRFILLVTDGAPACNDSIATESCTCIMDPIYCEGHSGNCLDDDTTVARTGELALGGIKTFVIGFDTDEWSDVLDKIAIAGDTGRDSYIPVSDGDGLAAALDGVSRSVLSCNFNLQMAPENYRYVSVTVDGNPIDHVSVHDDGNGWELDGAQTIQLMGDSCTAIQDGEDHEVEIVVECAPVLI